jgi:HD-GYP domain-containing protein (c-di-GMP phosphodiesterase class II)
MSNPETTQIPTPDKPNQPVGLHKSIAGAFLALLEIERPPLIAHCRRVARWARELGALTALSDQDLDELEAAALLHDIGFMSSSMSSLYTLSLDRSTDEKAKRHPLVGFSVLSQLTGFENIAKAVLHHHERFDGLGYPKKLKGEQIPLFSRIISVADIFDLETHPAGTVMPDLDNVRKKILQERNRSLDPEIANRFLFIVTTTDDLHRQDKKTIELPLSALKAGMVLARDLKTIDGTFLLRAGVVLTDTVLNKAFSSQNLEWLLTTAHVDASSIPGEGA